MWLVAIVGLVVALVSNIAFLMLGISSVFEPLALLAPEEETVVQKEQTKFFTFRSKEIANLIKDLEKNKEKFIHKNEEVDGMEEVVNAEKKELEQTRKELEALRDKIIKNITILEKAEAKNLKELATAYSNMPPETVVEVFNKMDDVFVLKILSFFAPDLVAPVFQAMVANSAEPKLATERVVRLTKLMRLKTDAFE